MLDYKKLYYELFNDVTDIISKLEEVQQKAEMRVISNECNNEEEEDF